MERSKWHHYVPQGVLSKFCYSGSKLYYYSKNRCSEGVDSRDIEKKFRKRHYYSVTTPTGQKSDILEREFLQVLDSKFVEFVTQFSVAFSAGKLPVIDVPTRGFLQQFLYYYAKRNPDFERQSGIYPDSPVEEVKKTLSSFEKAFGEIDRLEFARLTEPKKADEIFQFARVASLARSSPEVNERLGRMSVHFAIAPNNKQFVIGSNPVVRLENQKNAVLGDGFVELWTPILPRVMLGFAGPNAGFDEFIHIPTEEVRKVNVQMFKQSTEVGGASRRLIQSLV